MSDTDQDDHPQVYIYADPDKIAAVKIILGLEPYGALGNDDEIALSGILSDVLNEALGEYAKCPERVKLLFDAEKIREKLHSAVAAELGLSRWGRDDVANSKIRDHLRTLRAERAAQPNRVDPTQMGLLLHADHTITEELAKVDKRRSRTAKR